MTSVTTFHLDPQVIAAFAEGRLDDRARAEALAHLDACAECMGDVSTAMLAAGEEAPARPLFRHVWLLAAAAVIAIALLLPIARNALRSAPIDALVAAAPRTARVVEPRLTGGFAWAEYAGPDRADDSALDAQRLKLGGAAGQLVERAERDPSPDAQHAAGVAMVLIDKPLEAIAKLEAVAKTRNDARAWSDLAAARYAAAVSLGRTSLLPTALAAADAALRIEPGLAEGLFNRALVLQKMGLTAEARRAWEKYLAVDATSAWANEARARLAELPPSTRASRFQRDQPLLERAAADGDTARVRELVGQYRQQARTFGEAEYLARWAEGGPEAERWLRTARAIGAALVQLSGESLLADSVAAIDNASARDRATLAAAHLAYRRGRIAYSKLDAATAERELRTAAASFAAATSPMALVARYYAASARLAQNDAAGARRELERARAEADARPRFIAVGAQVRWELARAHMFDDDWSGALAVLEQGAAMFRRLGERANESFVETMLANALVPLGRFDEAWDAHVRTFTALSAEGHSDMLASGIASALKQELRAGRDDAALALAGIELDEVRPALAVELLIQRAMLGGDASASIEKAASLARAIPDPALRERTLVLVSVARGSAAAEPAQAIQALTSAIDFYRRHDVIESLPEPLLLRARAFERLGDTAAALRDLEEGMAALARHREQAIGTGVLHAERALFTDAIRLALARGDQAAAFAYAESARGGTITLATLQQRLAGTETVVLELVALADEVVAFAVSNDDFSVARRGAATPLYEQVITPVEHLLAGARRLIIVPDRALENVSFAALYDERRGQYLVERFEVAMGANASSLQPRRDAPPRSALAMALPSGESSQSAGLPETEGELADVGASYAGATRAREATLGQLRAARADVIHIAGHTARERGAGDQALVFADGRASWKTIATLKPLHARVVVLAACETLRRPDAVQTRALSLAAAFAAAGAADVVGTLAPIADRHARVLFGSFHRHLAAGLSPAAALRAAQREGITAGDAAWKSVGLLTTTV